MNTLAIHWQAIVLLLLSAILIGCASIPAGVDPVRFRIAEAQLNVQDARDLVVVAGFPANDVARFNEVADDLESALDEALAATEDGTDAMSILRAAIPRLVEQAQKIDDPDLRDNALRLLALANLALRVQDRDERIQDILDRAQIVE